MRRPPLSLGLVVLACMLAPDAASGFDTGPHSDISRDALTAEGFGNTAVDVANVDNWFVDLYSNASKIPQSGHSTIGKGILGSLLGPRENWPDAVVKAATRTHFDSSRDDIANAERVQKEWERLMRNTLSLGFNARVHNKPLELLTAIGMSLHELEDFYSHSNWIEQQGFEGVDGTDWSKLTFGQTPTWFDVPAEKRAQLNVYIGETTGHKRTHGGWNSDGNRSMKSGVNKDWPGRPGYANAYMTAYFATRQWLRALRTALADDAFWTRAQRYAGREGRSLDHDLRGALGIGMMSGHWSGEGEPCNPEWSFNICGSRNGPGGDLIGLRNATRDFFEDHGKTLFRRTFERLIVPLGADAQPTASVLPITSSQDLQRSTRFVQLQVPRMRGIDLGDPGPDDADMFTRATIAGQSFQSGEINSHDSWSFPLPTSAFTFMKAVPASGAYRTPITSMNVEIRTSSSRFSGTDDDVHLRIGPSLRFALDKSLYDDFERGDRDTYSVPIDAAARAGLSLADLRQIQIEKSPDGVAGGWKLRGVKVIVNGRQVYARDGIETWLEDDHRTWRAPGFTPSSPATQALPVSLDLWDEDSNIYGSDDHGDINPFASRKTLTLAYTPGTNIDTTATGGATLGGRLGDGDKATLRYRLQTLKPVAAPLFVAPPVTQTPVVVEPPPPPPPVKKADLVISAMDFNPTDSYFFTVTNQGEAAAGPFTVTVGTGSYPITGLAAGASVTRTWATCTNGTFVATADALAQIDESSETNNTRSYEANCIF